MDKVSVFESSDFGEIRVMVINDQPWFVGSEGVAFIRWLAVQDYLGEKINWKDLT